MIQTQEAQACVLLLWNGIITALLAVGWYHMANEPLLSIAYGFLLASLSFGVNLRLYVEAPI